MSATPWDIAAERIHRDPDGWTRRAELIREACEAHAAALVLHANTVEKERDAALVALQELRDAADTNYVATELLLRIERLLAPEPKPERDPQIGGLP